MTFTVTKRIADGSTTTEVVEAGSRTEVFSLKKPGETILRVESGGTAKGAGGHAGPGFQTSKALAAVGIASLMAFLVGGVWLAVSGRGGGAGRKEGPSAVSQGAVKTPPPTTVARKDAEPGGRAAAPGPFAVVEHDEASATNVVSVEVTTNGNRILEKTLTADGKLHISARNAARPVFSNASDQVLAMAMGVKPGQSMPPIPMSADIDRSFLKSLETEIVINPDDPETVKRAKANVRQAREDMKALLKKGYSVQDVLKDHQKLVNENAKIRGGAVNELKSLIKAGDMEGAKNYVAKMNEAFREMGIMEIAMPATTDEERAAKREERKALRAEKNLTTEDK